MNSKISILLIGPFPGPLSGVSIANQVVSEVLSDDSQFEVDIINTSYSRFDEEIGKFSFKNPCSPPLPNYCRPQALARLWP